MLPRGKKSIQIIPLSSKKKLWPLVEGEKTDINLLCYCDREHWDFLVTYHWGWNLNIKFWILVQNAICGMAWYKFKSTRRRKIPTLQNEESMVLGHFSSPDTTINLASYIEVCTHIKKTENSNNSSEMSQLMILHSNVWHPHRWAHQWDDCKIWMDYVTLLSLEFGQIIACQVVNHVLGHYTTTVYPLNKKH